MSAWRIAANAWPWMVAIWLGELLVAALSAYAVRSHIAAAMADFAVPDDHLLYAIAELGNAHPQLAVAVLLALGASMLVGAVVWMLVAPAVLLRVDGTERGPGELAASWATRLGPASAATGWHAGLRVVFVLVGGGGLAALPPVFALSLGFVVVLAATVAQDLSRVAVVLDDASGRSPRIAIEGFVRMATHWRQAVVMSIIAAAQWALAITAIVAVVRTGGEALAVARAAAAAATCLGVLRLAIAASTARKGPPEAPAS